MSSSILRLEDQRTYLGCDGPQPRRANVATQILTMLSKSPLCSHLHLRVEETYVNPQRVRLVLALSAP